MVFGWGKLCFRLCSEGERGLVVLVDEVQAAVVRDEGRDLLAVLDQLGAAALADGAVRLLRFDADLLAFVRDPGSQ